MRDGSCLVHIPRMNMFPGWKTRVLLKIEKNGKAASTRRPPKRWKDKACGQHHKRNNNENRQNKPKAYEKRK